MTTDLSRDSLATTHGALPFPVFLPDATRAVVRGVDSADLEVVGVRGLVMSSFHLIQQPGMTTVSKLGGLHRFSGWNAPIITDSGGFQVYSLVRQNPKYGSLNERGMIYRAEDGSKYNLTPEKSIQLQISAGADVVYCLDDCTHADDAPDQQADAVRRTIKWARRCREVFDELIAGKRLDEASRPRLFGVVQGGRDLTLRRQCAEELLAIGFDGYGYGGWPLDSDNQLLTEVFAYVRSVIPERYAIHALGVGHPANITACVRLGYDIFDSALPTRDARRGRLYRFTVDPAESRLEADGDWFRFIYLEDDKHIKRPPRSMRPVTALRAGVIRWDTCTT